MWEHFREEFLALWSAAVENGSGGDLALPMLFGRDAPDGAQALDVSGIRTAVTPVQAPSAPWAASMLG